MRGRTGTCPINWSAAVPSETSALVETEDSDRSEGCWCVCDLGVSSIDRRGETYGTWSRALWQRNSKRASVNALAGTQIDLVALKAETDRSDCSEKGLGPRASCGDGRAGGRLSVEGRGQQASAHR